MGLIGRRDPPLASDSRDGLEMVLLWILAFRPADAGGVPRMPLKDLEISKAMIDPTNSLVVGTASPALVAAVAVAPVMAASVEAPIAPPAASSAPPAAVEVRVAETVVEELVAVAEVVDLSWEEPVPSLAVGLEPEPKPEPKPGPEPKPELLVVEVPSVPPAAAVKAVVKTILEALPTMLPVAPDEQDEQSDEPPPVDDYYGVDMDTPTYPDTASEPDMVAVGEPLLTTKPAIGLTVEWLGLFPRLDLGGLTANIAANCTLVVADDDH